MAGISSKTKGGWRTESERDCSSPIPVRVKPHNLSITRTQNISLWSHLRSTASANYFNPAKSFDGCPRACCCPQLCRVQWFLLLSAGLLQSNELELSVVLK
ncbi:hypothetical protein MHYP_G00151620 [Metynnis hypsauchen]